LKRRGAKIAAKWRDQQKAFAEIAHRKKFLQRKLRILKRKLALGRKYDRHMIREEREVIKGRENLMKVVHRDHLLELRLRRLKREIQKKRRILKRRGAKIAAKWRDQQKAFAEIAHRKKFLQRKLRILKRKLALGRKYDRHMIREEREVFFKREHKALMILEKKIAKQQKLIRHLRVLYSCGKLQRLVRKKIPHLLKSEGRRLEQLVHVLYAVERKVSRLSKTLRRNHSERRRELKRAERYMKWAHQMIRLSHHHKLHHRHVHLRHRNVGHHHRHRHVVI